MTGDNIGCNMKIIPLGIVPSSFYYFFLQSLHGYKDQGEIERQIISGFN